MEGTEPSYLQECYTETARVKMPALQVKTSQQAEERPGMVKYRWIEVIFFKKIKQSKSLRIEFKIKK